MAILPIDDDIVLKILEPEDAHPLFALVESNRMYLRQWLPWVDTNATLENSRAFIQSAMEQQELKLGFQCGMWFQGTFAGIIGFQRIDWMNRNVEIGYWLGENFQGHGIVTKACRILVEYAFNEYQLNRVQIRCASGNTKSLAVMERLGFIQEGMTLQAEFLYDHYVDLYIYGMTADTWKARYGENPKTMGWVQ